MRLEATARSYQARVADVVDRHRMRVRVSPVAGLVCTLPTYRITARLWRRTASADVAFSWNPIDRRVETRCCDACNRPTRAAALCDERVHYLCARCLGPCAHCGKAFCRACHRGCPKHGRQATVDGR